MGETTQNEGNIWGIIREHIELIAAIVSGIFILAGWILSNNHEQTLSIILFILAFVIGGYAKAKEGIIDTIESKRLNVEILMILAAIGSSIIGYWTEGAILIFIFSLSGALETYTMNKSHKEISSLMELQPEEAILLQLDGKERKVAVADLQIGDRILIKAGERVPSDGMIVDGSTHIDEAAITGESLPVSKKESDEVFAGTVNLRGTIVVEITKEQEETLFQKIIQLVQSAQSEKSPSQLFIEKFEGTYVNIVLIAVGIMMFLPHFVLGWSWNETVYRAMVLLVVASPCALAASIMPATLSAISNGARRGILFKGGVHIENLGNLKAIAMDKTGTLTKGKPEVNDVLFRDDLTKEEFLLYVASVEKYSNHPLAQSIVKYASEHTSIECIKPDTSEDISGFGAQATFGGKQWKVGKADFVDREEAYRFQDGIGKKLAGEGKTIVYVRDEKGIAGLITLKDMVRKETIEAIEKLKSVGVHTIMLTGDGMATARAIAEESHIDGYVAECLPETKVDELKKLKQEYGTVAMVGDGINDAPALATASIGIAMGEGTDVALETADVVLMKNNLSLIAEAVLLSRKMNKIIKQNVIFSLTVIVVLICSNFLQFINLPYGVIGHEGSTILVILNGLRLLRPMRWS
ncbi:heavy metal translocating P-type ATPase [Bacillus sp. 1P06AnD]